MCLKRMRAEEKRRSRVRAGQITQYLQAIVRIPAVMLSEIGNRSGFWAED